VAREEVVRHIANAVHGDDERLVMTFSEEDFLAGG
jgi:hypothetical protein